MRRTPRPQPPSPAGRTTPTPGRPAAGLARDCAVPGLPCARSAPAWCRGQPCAGMTFIVPPMTPAPTSLITGIDPPLTHRLIDRAQPFHDLAVYGRGFP